MATALAIALVLGTGTGAAAADDRALTDLIQILRNEGVIDDAQYTELATRAAQKDAGGESWTDRISLGATLRLRYEGFWFEEDPFGSPTAGEDRPNRHRGRYKLRVRGQGKVNDHATVKFRLSTGGDDSRSSNQSLGADDRNFDDDLISIDRAYAVLTPFANGEIPGREGWWGFEVGKVPNGLVWKKGYDQLLWDSDMNPEGAQMRWRRQVTDQFGYFSNSAVYILDENSGSKDQKMAATQLGAWLKPTDALETGARFTWYRFWDLDGSYLTSLESTTLPGDGTGGGGNIVGELTGFESDFDVMEAAAYLDILCLENWPMRVYGSYVRNLDAVNVGPGGGDEDTAWSVGGQVGDKKKYVQLGFVWGHMEANAFPSVLIDSDWLGGRTNREGFAASVKRRLLEATDFSVTVFKSTEIQDGPIFVDSLSGADRWRVQVNLEMAIGG